MRQKPLRCNEACGVRVCDRRRNHLVKSDSGNFNCVVLKKLTAPRPGRGSGPRSSDGNSSSHRLDLALSVKTAKVHWSYAAARPKLTHTWKHTHTHTHLVNYKAF